MLVETVQVFHRSERPVFFSEIQTIIFSSVSFSIFSILIKHQFFVTILFVYQQEITLLMRSANKSW